MEHAASDAHWKPRSSPWLIAVVVTLAAFMEILDSTIVNVSLPHIAGSLASTYDEATWTLTSYLVANGVVLPISGSLGRIIGRKRYFMICIAMFTVASFLCGIATSLPELVIFRLLQGLFGGGLQPNQQSIILDTFEPSQRGRAFSIVAVAVIFAPIIGPTLGGYITDAYSWRWIFFLNVPIGVAAVFLVDILVEDPPWVQRDRERWANLDFTGISLIAIGLGSLQIMLDKGEDNDWFTSPFIRMMGIIAVVGIITAIVWLLQAKKPVLDLRMFKDRNFTVGSLVVMAIFAILYSSAVLIPQLAQTHLDYTAEWAGLVLSPGGVVVLLLIPLVSRLLPHVQTRYIIAFGFFVLGCALLYSTNLTPTLSFWDLAMLRMAQTAGLAFLFVPNSAITYSTLPRRLNADASSMYVMLRNIAGSVGISLGTAMVVDQTQVHHAYLAGHLTPLNPAFNALVHTDEHALRALGYAPDTLHATAMGLINQQLNLQAAILSYVDVFSVTAIMAFCMVPVVLLFRGSKMGGKQAAAAH